MKVRELHIEVIKAAARGESGAVSQVIHRYQHLAYTAAIRVLRNPVEAEEAAQDGLLKALKALSGFRGESKFSTWVYRIVYRTAINYRRKYQEREQSGLETLALQGEVDRSRVEAAERKAFVEMALAQMKPEAANLLTLYYLEEYSLGEIAKMLDLSSSNAKIKMYRARKQLATILEKWLNKETKSLI